MAPRRSKYDRAILRYNYGGNGGSGRHAIARFGSLPQFSDSAHQPARADQAQNEASFAEDFLTTKNTQILTTKNTKSTKIF